MRIFTLSWLFWTILILSLAALPGNRDILIISSLVLFCIIVWPRSRSFCAGYFAACIALGWALFQIDSRQLDASEISSDLRIRVKVASVPQVSDWGVRFNARVLSCESCVSEFGPKLLQLSWYGHHEAVRAGDEWEFTVRLKPFRGLRNVGSFDRSQWSIYNGLDARGYVRAKQPVVKLSSSTKHSMLSIRADIAERIVNLPSSDPHASMIQALVLGIKQGIDSNTWDLLRDTGTSHLIAISGLHISLLAAWAYLLSRRVLPHLLMFCVPRSAVLNRIDTRLVSLLISVSVAAVYSLLAGFELPVQRALSMLIVWAIAALTLRHLAPALGLTMAMLAVMASNIMGVLSPGFWLSFGTVSVLFYLHQGHIQSYSQQESVDTLLSKAHGSLWRAVAAMKTHVRLGIVLLPITAWFFQAGSLLAPVANLVAVPWVGFVVVPLSFLTALLSVASTSAANFFLELTQLSISVLLSYLERLSAFEFTSVPLAVPSGAALLLGLLGMLLFFSPKGAGLRRYSLLLFLPLLLFNARAERVEGFDVHVLDVGQGLATLVLTAKHSLLFDTGGKLSGSLSMFEAVVLPYLHAQGRRKIDYLVVSHSDEDHAFGVNDVLRRFPDTQMIVGGELLSEQQWVSEPCRAGDKWAIDDLQISVLNPLEGATGSDNDRSCVLLLHLGASRVLLTGDIERNGELLLSSRFNPLALAGFVPFPVDLLVAPHHGSHTSSTPNLLKTIKPDHVVFAAGHRNRYGFPHADVQMRYKLVGARQYITGTLGSTVFSFGRQGLLEPPKTWWQTHRRFWHGFVNPACSDQFSGHATVIQQLMLAQKGQLLCGK
ncbi:MAG: DNA internalization-related competence protein ComEC/Rec2 [Granulosicoccus sp.]